MITPETMLGSGTVSITSGQYDHVVFLYATSEGTSVIVRSTFRESALPEPEVLQMHHIALNQGILVIWLVYNVGSPYTQKHMLVRVTRD